MSHALKKKSNFLDAARRESLCFRENLLVVLKDKIENSSKPVGGFSISVEKIGALGLEFLVHVVSSMKVDGFFGGSKVIGSVTEKFHCLEEKRNECVNFSISNFFNFNGMRYLVTYHVSYVSFSGFFAHNNKYFLLKLWEILKI